MVDAARGFDLGQRSLRSAAIVLAGLIGVGKDADLALYDGDPFEYTSHCIGVIIDGRVVSDEVR